ncbi:NAD(P)-dependent oxidoreductase [Enterocloster aldenensis]|uniref:NAD-dependent epimerase/dehydratase family protein n=1 Tax=Enterocloster aldenensis TaxID=358742 RepID=UPI000E4E3256|nr:NAD(P)-dependent oxidoreductase [Enterocloster aldenensis]
MDLSIFEEKTIFVTGATGLIGKTIIKTLLEYNSISKKKIRIIAGVRNLDKAYKIFSKYNQNDLEYLVADLYNLKPFKLNIDYIIHAASQTSSKAFISEPVETIITAIKGTRNVMEIARANNVLGVVYLSSMEVYGSPSTDNKIDESYSTNLNTMAIRSCYPESKRMCENLCASYFSEYQVPVMIIRLTQTFGEGVEYNDSRVFAEFARCVIERRNIQLNTKGQTKRSYLYIQDAVDAILTVLINGKPCEAYNAANENTYCSIYDMACMVARECAEERITIEICESDISKFGYAPILHMNLDTSKLKSLNWTPSVDLKEMFSRMINDMKQHKKSDNIG